MAGPRFTRAACSMLCLLALLPCGAGCALLHGQRYASFTTQAPLAANECLVIGFQGGVEAWNSRTQGVTKLAVRLRSRGLSGVHVETVENRRRALALELIRRSFDRNRDGILDGEERSSVRLVVYGVSFGGAAVVKLARQLEAVQVPVLLTIQVDSVGRHDAVIPANVATAINLYQSDGMFVRGERTIRAQDPAKTRMLGNVRFEYRNKAVDLSEVPWYKRIFRVAHSKMSADPEVWARVEQLILEAVSPRGSAPQAGRGVRDDAACR